MLTAPFFDVAPALLTLAKAAERSCAGVFAHADGTAHHNAAKVLAAFGRHSVSERHFAGSSGYGYGDMGRETLDAVYADVLGAQSALVRHNFVSGTHALTVALFGVLRPGDTLCALTGRPYDTLEGVIGIGDSGGENQGSLRDFGVHYRELPLLPGGTPDMAGIPAAVRGARVAIIQRSRGYSLRPSLSIADISEVIIAAKAANPDIIIVVDNCYGELVEQLEPCDVGADLTVGSLIKNPGGGIARTGGYIAGRQELVDRCAYRLTAPGAGREVGCTLGMQRELFLGLFMAPTVVQSALQTAIFAAALFALLGFEVFPSACEPRTDIIQSLLLGSRERLIAFCRGIQRGSPVDSFAAPEPWAMPGYSDEVIMAAGAFTMGASIELSADAPLREPYAVFLQGGLSYPTGRLGVLLAAQEMLEQGLIGSDTLREALARSAQQEVI